MSIQDIAGAVKYVWASGNICRVGVVLNCSFNTQYKLLILIFHFNVF